MIVGSIEYVDVLLVSIMRLELLPHDEDFTRDRFYFEYWTKR